MFYTNVQPHGNYIALRGVDNRGVSFQEKVRYEPTLYVPSQKKSIWKTLDGKLVSSVKWGSMKESRQAMKDYGSDVYGIDQFQYKSYDGALYANENAVVSITVSPVNDMPIFTSGGNVQTSENLGTMEVFGWASDISDGDPELTQALEFTLTALNPDLFEVQPTIDLVFGTLSFTDFT